MKKVETTDQKNCQCIKKHDHKFMNYDQGKTLNTTMKLTCVLSRPTPNKLIETKVR